MAEKDILKFVQSSKYIIDADFDDENEMNNAHPILASSEMRNIMRKQCADIKFCVLVGKPPEKLEMLKKAYGNEFSTREFFLFVSMAHNETAGTSFCGFR
ncbi:hypothetical protein TNCV_4505481 [Trichonephila clavipes]|nr:hypothetical protein TNCV_4505481 [Trichonephila clavipes]